jgi:3-deoxy-D-arabino-heptulosonate 7-phosphate (DAHP) synthase
MMNIDDKSMVNSMTENKHPNDAPARSKVTSKTEETKKIFSELIHGRDNKYVVNSGICDVMKQMWAQKEQRSAWKNSSN